MSSDLYDRAVQRERNKRRRTEPDHEPEPEPEPDDTMATKSIGTQTVITMNEVESLMKSETHAACQGTGGATADMCTVRTG